VMLLKPPPMKPDADFARAAKEWAGRGTGAGTRPYTQAAASQGDS
jgi:hypothetical protein